VTRSEARPEAVRKARPHTEARAKTVQPKPVVVARPKPPEATELTAPRRVEAPTKAQESPPHEGLLLRFDSDTALLALVAKRQVSVYAWVRDTAWRLSSERGALRFTSATAPRRFHHMTPDTVPDDVVRALRDTAATAGRVEDVTWGVTLPADTQRQLELLGLKKHRRGEPGQITTENYW